MRQKLSGSSLVALRDPFQILKSGSLSEPFILRMGRLSVRDKEERNEQSARSQ